MNMEEQDESGEAVSGWDSDNLGQKRGTIGHNMRLPDNAKHSKMMASGAKAALAFPSTADESVIVKDGCKAKRTRYISIADEFGHAPLRKNTKQIASSPAGCLLFCFPCLLHVQTYLSYPYLCCALGWACNCYLDRISRGWTDLGR